MNCQLPKPPPCPVKDKNIPDELKEGSCFVGWRWKLEKNKKGEFKWDKPLYNVNKPRKYAKTNDPETWSTFEKALQGHKEGKFDGIGRCFSGNRDLVGIDLDKCRSADGKPTSWADEIIKKFNSYTEITPSGTGFRVWARGKKPGPRSKQGNIEIYDSTSTRYLTITGHLYDRTPRTIEHRQDAINWVYEKYFLEKTAPSLQEKPVISRVQGTDAEIIRKVIESRNGDKFNLLFKGLWEDAGYPSWSEGDQAFCNMLAFWFAKDAVRMDSIFRQSGLMRPKWDKKHFGDGRTYGKATTERAIASCNEIYKPHAKENSPDRGDKQLEDLATRKEKSSYSVIAISDFLSLKLPPRENILSPWLPKQGLAMIHSKRGIGKTFVALNIAYAVACGGSFLRWDAPQPSGVLFIDGEMPGNVIQERLAQIVLCNEIEPQKPLLIMSPDLQDGGMPDLSLSEGQKAINGYLSKEIEIVIVDNISTLSRSGKENEAQSWLPLQEWALRLRALGKTVLFIHHSGKTGLQRGTSKREDILDTVINLRHTFDYEPMQGACFEIHFEKSRGIYGADVEPFEARLEGGLWTMKNLKTSSLEKVIRLTKDGYSQKEIADEIGKNKGYISRLVKQAKESGALP
jgi:hypothetical protein